MRDETILKMELSYIPCKEILRLNPTNSIYDNFNSFKKRDRENIINKTIPKRQNQTLASLVGLFLLCNKYRVVIAYPIDNIPGKLIYIKSKNILIIVKANRAGIVYLYTTSGYLGRWIKNHLQPTWNGICHLFKLKSKQLNPNGFHWNFFLISLKLLRLYSILFHQGLLPLLLPTISHET